jgi:hypothetical protein
VKQEESVRAYVPIRVAVKGGRDRDDTVRRRISQEHGSEGMCPKHASKSNGTWDLDARGHCIAEALPYNESHEVLSYSGDLKP